ncbi:MAG: DUF3696 domain-containing protein, partial [Rhizobacter sp.]|nr:DUF3696 domain-containing protein [Chlorobiales bacterium]
EKTVQVLFQDKSQTEQRRKGLLAKVEFWLKTFGFGHEPEIEELGGDNYRLLIKDANTGIAVNVSDVGFGVSQVLPVIVQGFAASDNATLIIEQPEIHLHPKAQSELGDLMIDIAGIKAGEKSAQPKTLLIETHSEHLIRRLQLRIAEKQISEQDVAIYFVQATAEGSQFGKVTLDKYGRFENWPEGFFSEDAGEMFHLQDAIFERLKADKENKPVESH